MHTEYRLVMATLVGFTALAVLSVINPIIDLTITIAGTIALAVALVTETVHYRRTRDPARTHSVPTELVRRR